jgi:PAS domain S-box-containing protein
VNSVIDSNHANTVKGAKLTAQNEGLYRLLVDRVLDYAIFALDPDGYILSWNAGAQRLKGYTPDEIIGKHFTIFYTAEDLSAGKPAAELKTAIAEGQVEDIGWRLRKDGTRFWANVLITAMRDDDGRLLGFAKVTRDLTARKLAEEKLRESEERFRLLVESVTDYAVYMLDVSGHITTWNIGAQRIKGYSAEEVIGSHFSAFYTKEDIESGKPERDLAIAASEGKYEEEGWRIRKNGTRFIANVIITPIRGIDGKLVGFAKVTRDLTERRAAQERALDDARRIAAEEAARTTAEQKASELSELSERLRLQAEELERQSAQAETANRAKGEFLAAMSHELRTPLNAIGGYAQLMQMGISGPVTEDQQRQLDRIQRSQQHLLGIINDILNFSRIEAGQIHYDFGPVAMGELIAAVAPMVAPQAQQKHVSVQLPQCPPSLVAHADHSKVEQILLNLLSNAVKFTDENGRIEVTCEAVGDHVKVSVRDSGIGIAEDQIETIFAPFVQVGRSLASPKEGTGLGLAISRDLAQAMRGELTAESREGIGSAFTLTLPRHG